MALKQEQVLFGLTLLLLSWWTFADLSAGEGRRAAPRPGEAPHLDRHSAPDPGRALPTREALVELPRDLFTPPRDTAPLPALEMQAPPRPARRGLLPPPSPWLATKSWSELLDAATAVTSVAGLFAEDGLAQGPPAEVDDEAGPDGSPDADLLSAEERAERILLWKRTFDWIEPTNHAALKFGSIRNKDRYKLFQRPQEPLLFVEVKPETGEPLHPANFPPIEYGPDRVATWGFAETPYNRVQVFRAQVGDSLSPSGLNDAMAVVDLCVAERHSHPELLALAEEICDIAARVHGAEGDQDPLVLLKKVTVLDAGFQGERAYALIQDLLAHGQHTSPFVWVRLAELEARYRLFDQAEEHFARAVSLNGAHHAARLALGRFLLQRGRAGEALAHLIEAEKREPSGSDGKGQRLQTRRSLGQAQLAVGDLPAAAAAFGRALSVEALDADSLAGLLATALLVDDPAPRSSAEAAESAFLAGGGTASVDLLLVQGFRALKGADFLLAKRQWSLAALADPFRAQEAWRALSFLAEVTGHPEEARQFIDRAWQAAPDDTYTLYQRARLFLQDDDLEGAEEMLRGALDQELEFPAALSLLAEVEQQTGHGDHAELWFERAAELMPKNALLHALRGANLLELLQVEAAEASFQRALALQRGQAYARNGLAWCAYSRADSREALVQYGELAELLRDPKDPQRVFAESQAKRIVEHEAKEVWVDSFDRPSGLLVGNSWETEIGFGPEVRLEEGQVRVQGLFESAGAMRVLRQEPVDAFLSFEATLRVEAPTRARVGIFVGRERTSRSSGRESLAAVSLSRIFGAQGTLEPVRVGLSHQGEAEVDERDLFSTPWIEGTPLRLAITRRGEGSDTVLDLWVDGQEVLSGLPFARLFTGSSALSFGLFVQGEQGRTADVTLDDVRVVRRRP